MRREKLPRTVWLVCSQLIPYTNLSPGSLYQGMSKIMRTIIASTKFLNPCNVDALTVTLPSHFLF